MSCACAHCGRSIDERYETVWKKVEGWEKKRGSGGTNHLALRKNIGSFMCAVCMDKLLSGLSASQLSFA